MRFFYLAYKDWPNLRQVVAEIVMQPGDSSTGITMYEQEINSYQVTVSRYVLVLWYIVGGVKFLLLGF